MLDVNNLLQPFCSLVLKWGKLCGMNFMSGSTQNDACQCMKEVLLHVLLVYLFHFIRVKKALNSQMSMLNNGFSPKVGVPVAYINPQIPKAWSMQIHL